MIPDRQPPRQRDDRDDGGQVDLSALDPDRNGASQAFIDGVMGRIAGRPLPVRHDELLVTWSAVRAAAIAAGILLALALGSAALLPGSSSTGPATMEESLGVPPLFTTASR